MARKKYGLVASRKIMVKPGMPERTSLLDERRRIWRHEVEKAIKRLARAEGEKFTITYMEGVVNGLIGKDEVQTYDEAQQVIQVVNRWAENEKKN